MIRRHSERARYSSTPSKSSWISFRRPSILSRDSGLLATSHLQKWALPRNEWVKSCCLCITQALQNGLPLPRHRRIGLNLLRRPKRRRHGMGSRQLLCFLKAIVKAIGKSNWGHPQTGSYLAQFEAVFFGTFFASSANRC